MFTYLALILRIVSNPLANVFQKKLTAKHIPARVINLATYFFLSLFSFLPALFINWNVLPASVWINAVIGGFLGALGNSCLIKALCGGDLSVLGPINSYKSVAAMIIAIFVLHEIPSVYGIAGILLIIWGSYFIFETTEEGFSLKIFKRNDIRLRLYATVLTAIEAVFIKKVIVLSSPMVSFILWCWFGFIFSLILHKLIKTNNRLIKNISLREIKFCLGIVLCIGIMQLSTNYVFEKMNVSYALALFQLSMILTVIFGWRFFNEKDIKKKIIGTIIMILGSILVILF